MENLETEDVVGLAMTEKVAKDQLEKWLKYRRATPAQRKAYEMKLEHLVYSLMHGELVLNDDMSLEQTLIVSLGSQNPIKVLKFQPRLHLPALTEKLKGVASDNGDERILGYMAALTGTQRGILKDMCGDDHRIAEAIVLFFL